MVLKKFTFKLFILIFQGVFVSICNMTALQNKAIKVRVRVLLLTHFQMQKAKQCSDLDPSMIFEHFAVDTIC